MPLLPALPVIEDENLGSYLSRTARFHSGRHVFDFLDMIELSRTSVMAPDAATIDRIASLTGLTDDRILRMCFRPAGGRMRKLASETFHAEFANLNQTSFCPGCLLEDGLPASPSHGERVGRTSWQIEPVRVCRRHEVPLYRRSVVSHAERFQLMADVAPDDQTLAEMLSVSATMRPSGLQLYIENRLGGQSGPAWLDAQPIDLAARACEMLGVILTHDPDVTLPSVTNVEWVKAGEVGYAFASQGAEGVQAGLSEAMERFAASGGKGGPQKAFGKLYKWLQFSKNAKPVGPIKDMVREFVLDHFPVASGTELFGEEVTKQRVHSAHSLSEASGQHLKTLYRAAVLSGLCDGDPDRPVAHTTFDAEAGEALARRIANSISVAQLPAYLNCNRTLAQQLVRTGVIPKLLSDDSKASGVLKHVAMEDVDEFLNRLLSNALIVKAPSKGTCDLVTAAEISRWPVIDIIGGILSGVIERVESLDPAMKINGLLVDPSEVRSALAKERSAGRVGANEAARLLGMHRQAFANLVRLNRPDGTPYLSHDRVTNSKGSTVNVFHRGALDAFAAEYISLKDYAASQSWAPKPMKAKLDAQGIAPILGSHNLGRFYYRRADLAPV